MTIPRVLLHALCRPPRRDTRLRLAFTRSNFSTVSHDWKRESYAAALVGPDAIRHKDLVERAGYRVVIAADGAAASELFVGEPVDIIVLDFALSGRPPEAVLLFSRRTSSDAPVIALVPADTDDGYRRAFLAGARDVLPTPSRGEDLLAAIDVAIEPRALAEVIERLQGGAEDDDEGTNVDGGGQRAALLTGEIEKLRREHDERVRVLEDDLDSFRRQALDAVTERDHLVDSRANARRRLADVKKELKEREAHLSMTEQACEALQRKLKDARDHRRHLETKTKDSKAALAKANAEVLASKAELASKEQASNAQPSSEERGKRKSIDRSITLAPDEVIDALADGFIDPEEALRVRAVDENRLAELEDAYEKFQASEARIQELEAQLSANSADVFRTSDDSDDEQLNSREALEEEKRTRKRLEEQVLYLENTLQAHKSEDGRIAELEAQLHAAQTLLHNLDDALGDDEAASQATAALALEQEARAEALGRLDAVGVERDGLKLRLRDSEREAADALTRLEELDPLVGEMEQVRLELHAERLRHMSTRRLLDQVSVDSTESTAAAELRRAQAEEERMQRVLDGEKRKLSETQKDLDNARSQIERLAGEREQMRMTIAALASDERQRPMLDDDNNASNAEDLDGTSPSLGDSNTDVVQESAVDAAPANDNDEPDDDEPGSNPSDTNPSDTNPSDTNASAHNGGHVNGKPSDELEVTLASKAPLPISGTGPLPPGSLDSIDATSPNEDTKDE